ncbi:MAG: carbohydrate ABC transporter permease [Chloroflexota bacterium]
MASNTVAHRASTGQPLLTRKARRTLHKIALYVTLAIVSIPVLFVFYWMVITSFKDGLQSTAFPPLFVFTPTLKNYQDVLSTTPFLTFIWNSLVVGVGATGLGLALGLPAAYSVAKFRQQGLALAVLIARMTPGIAYLIPWFILFTRMRLVDTPAALILSHLILTLPMTMWIMISFFEDLPREVEEAALIDGCSIYGVFWRVALPLTMPGIVASSILSFIFSWNNFQFALILGGDRTRTVPVAVFSFMTFEGVNWGGVAAAATLICLPVIILALLIQRHIVSGLTLGSVKG